MADQKTTTKTTTTTRITDPLKCKVDKHENHLQKLVQNLSHANTHMEALSDLAERLRFHVEMKKTALENKPNPTGGKFEFETTKKDGGKFEFETTVKDGGNIQEGKEKEKCDSSNDKNDSKKSDDEKFEKKLKVDDDDDDKKHFKFPAKLVDREFLTSVETLIEGIALVRSEVNFGRLVREVKGSLMEDVQEWRNVVTVLQKYDDQVRRAVEYFQRQNDSAMD